MPYAQMETKYFRIHFFSLKFRVEWICGESFYAVRKAKKIQRQILPHVEKSRTGISEYGLEWRINKPKQ